jgi:hypothetical protein
VPIEEMLTCFYGGASWALYVLSVHASLTLSFKDNFNRSLRLPLILLDLAFFGAGGAIAEWCLIQRGFMYYANGWETLHAFVAYFATWSMLHTLLSMLTSQSRSSAGQIR